MSLSLGIRPEFLPTPFQMLLPMRPRLLPILLVCLFGYLLGLLLYSRMQEHTVPPFTATEEDALYSTGNPSALEGEQ